MSTRPLSRLANRHRAQLQQRETQDARTLTDAHERMGEQVEPTLTRLYSEIKAKQKELDAASSSGENSTEVGGKYSPHEDDSGPPTIPLSWLLENNRLANVKDAVAHGVDWFATLAKVIIGQARGWVAGVGNEAARLFMVAGKEQFTPNPAPPSLLTDLQVHVGGKISKIFDTMGREIAKKVGEAVHLGLSLGQRTNAIAERITQILDEPRWRALTIAKTELFQRFNDVLLLNYHSNAHVVAGWVWHCRLSPRSCVACIALHGTIHKLSEVLDDHPNGQCFAIPYIASMGELQSGVEWFEQQDEAAKREILGTAVAYELYATGKAALHDFVGIRHDHSYALSIYQRSAKQITGRN